MDNKVTTPSVMMDYNHKPLVRVERKVDPKLMDHFYDQGLWVWFSKN